MKKFIYLFITFLGLTNTTSAQASFLFKEGMSPQVALMNRYGNYPVNLSTGLIDISIPLYTLQTPHLSIPLALKFHASGLRADEREGYFGVRWTLTGTGHISRVIKGYPDDYHYPFNPKANHPTETPDVKSLFGTTSTQYHESNGWENTFFLADGGNYQDTEYDIFSFCLPNGKSGKFIIKDGMPHFMPYEPYLIYMDKQGDRLTGITLVDEDGTHYIFGAPYTDSNIDNYITTWHLKSITSANKKEEIIYSYDSPLAYSQQSYASLIISDNLYRHTGGFYNYNDPLYGQQVGSLYALVGELLTDPHNYFRYQTGSVSSRMYRSTSITIRQEGHLVETIHFDYQHSLGGDYLSALNVIDANTRNVKSIRFTLSDCSNNTLKTLDKLEISNTADPTAKEVYHFDYYGSVPNYSELRKKPDWWGYYSSYGSLLYGEKVMVNSLRTNNINDAISHVAQQMTIPGSTKQANEGSMLNGMLQAIHYPTGGHTEFEYEANRIGNRLYGGLRIKRVTSTTNNKNVNSKYYDYTGDVPEYLHDGSHNHFTENDIECYATKDGFSDNGNFIQRTYENGIPSWYTDFHSYPVYYNRVTEYNGYDSLSASGKTVYEYDTRMLPFSYFSTLSGDDFEGIPNGNGYKRGYVSPTDFWAGNKLRTKKIYKGNRLIKEYLYEYQIYRKESVYDMPVFQYRQYLTSNGQGAPDFYTEWNAIKNTPLSAIFAFKHQAYTIGAEKLVKETERTYHDNGEVTSVAKETLYEESHLLPSSETITNSNEDKKSIRYQYAFNFFEEPFKEMVAHHILSPVVQTEELIGESKKVTSTNYEKWDSSCFYPTTINSVMKGSNWNLMQYHNYLSSGRPLYATINDTEKIVCIWGYIHQHPVALIRNATYEQVCNALGGENFITALADKTVPTASDFQTLDALRSLLPQAQVTTATYQPLVGKLSETDPAGHTTYYNYDGLGRLTEVYIQNKNKKEILKLYQYHLLNEEE